MAEVMPLEEVQVTARKIQENLQDVPISITAFSAQDIENHGFRTLEDLDTTVPNFKLTRGQGYALDTTISIRGVSSRETSAGFEPTIAVVLDDVYVGRAIGFNSTLLDLERIEVLRGPQGSLQGRNVIGGAINLTTTRPTDEFLAKGRISYGSFNSFEVNGLLSGGLVKDFAAAKIAINHSQTDGWGNQVSLGTELGGADSTAVRAQIRFTPSDRLEILLGGDYTDDSVHDTGLDTDPDFTLTKASPLLLDRDFGGDFLNDSDRQIYGVALNVYYVLKNDMRFASISSYRGFDFESLLDQDNAATIANGGGFGVHSRALREQSQFSQEFRLHSADGQRLRWVAGLYYFNEDLDTGANGFFGPYIPGVGVLGTDNLSDANVKTESYAAFGSIDFDLSDKWRLAAGLRYDDSDRDSEVSESTRFDSFLPSGTPFVAITPANPAPTDFGFEIPFPVNTNSINDSELTGDASLTYQWNEQVSTYVKYARGFKGGGFNAQFSHGQAGGTVDPEYVDSYEIGLRSDLLDGRLRFNATAFYLNYQDQQVVNFLVGPAGITFITGNEPDTRSYGAEIEAKAALAEGLTLDVSVGLLDSEVKKGANDGKVPQDSPRFTFSTTLHYLHPIGSGNLELFLMATAGYSDDYFTDAANTAISHQPAYWMMNARAGIQSADGRWSVRVFGRNLADENIQSAALNVPGVFTLMALQEPRSYGVEASFQF